MSLVSFVVNMRTSQSRRLFSRALQILPGGVDSPVRAFKAGSGALTLGLPTSPGVTRAAVADTLVARYYDVGSVERLFDAHRGQIAAVIVEPIAGNMGVVPPADGFLRALRGLCTAERAVLIFDEVISGFRAGPGGAQQLWGVTPDLTCLGKII